MMRARYFNKQVIEESMISEDEFEPSRSSITIKQCIAAVRQHIHPVILSSLVILAAGIVETSLLPNVYRATTTILVDPQKIPEKYVASTITSDPNARMNTLMQQVLSASRLQEIIERNNLYPEMRKKASREEILDYMRSKTKIDIKPSPEPEQGLSSFTITYDSTNRDQVAPITNQLASSFIAWNLKARQQQALGTTQFLASELEEAKKSLEEQESVLQAYRMQHAGATPDALTGNLQALSRLESESESNADAISRLDQERILLSQMKSTDPREAPLNDRDRLLQEKRRLETERWNLKRQFTDTYPDVVVVTEQLKAVNARLATMSESTANPMEQIDSNTKVRLGLIEKDLQRHRELQANLQRQIQSFQGKVDSVPILETRLAELSRNYEVSRQNYQTLLDKTLSAGMSEELERKQQAERFTILDPAKTPEKPIKPKRIPFFAGAILASLLFPVGITIAIEALSGAIKGEVQLKEMLPAKVPLLGTIPPIANQTDLRRAKLMMVRTCLLLTFTFTALAIFLFKVRPTL
jgi:polysaccharide chain length determinant protein (PEP-CTERM system associated)